MAKKESYNIWRSEKMLIGVIYFAEKCPVHDSWEYHGLKCFQDKDELIDWLAKYTRINYFIKDVWDMELQRQSFIRVKYQKCLHYFIGVEVFEKEKKIAYIKQHLHGTDKQWIVEKGDFNGIL